MINLMPTQEKDSLKAARQNSLLLRYSGIIVMATAVLMGIIYTYGLLLNNTKMNAESLIETNNTEAGIYNETKKKVSTLTENLSAIETISQQEIKTAKILTNIAALMPSGTIINSITLNAQSFDEPTKVVISGKNTNLIIGMQSAFQASDLFSRVSFESVSESGGQIEGYPANVTINLTFKRGA